MSAAEWDGNANPQQAAQAAAMTPGYAGAPAPVAGDFDASAFTPEQWDAYQQAYQQAMQAQQLYTQAQQWYIQAQQTGQTEQAQQAYSQAEQAQQIYAQAHQTYLAILQQVQQAPAHAAPQGATPYPEQTAAPQANYVDPNQAYNPQVAPAPQAVAAAPNQAYNPQAGYVDPNQAYNPQAGYVDPNQAYNPQAGYAPQAVPVDSNPATYNPQIGYQQPQQAGYQGQVPPNQAYNPQAGYVDPNQAYNPQVGYVDPNQAAYNPQTGYPQTPYQQPQQVGYNPTADAFANASNNTNNYDEYVPDDWGADVQEGSIWSLLFWGVLFIAMIGSFVVLYFVFQPPPPAVFDDEIKTDKQSDEGGDEIRRRLMGTGQENESKYLRQLSLNHPKSFRSMALGGKGNCRSLYLSTRRDLYAAEGTVPKNDKDYLDRPVVDDTPFQLRAQGKLPKQLKHLTLVQGRGGSFIVARSEVSGQAWLSVFPLVGNPTKTGKGECGKSGVGHFVRSKEAILVGSGPCKTAASTLGLKPKFCVNADVSKAGPLLPFGTGSSAEGAKLVLGNQYVTLKRNAEVTDANELGQMLSRSTTLMPELSANRWAALDKTTGQLWTVDSKMKVNKTGAKIPSETAQKAVGAMLNRGVLRVVLLDKLQKYRLNGSQLTKSGEFSFGTGIFVDEAIWGLQGNILLLRMKTYSIYQFSETP